jgi:hypothetical protein
MEVRLSLLLPLLDLERGIPFNLSPAALLLLTLATLLELLLALHSLLDSSCTEILLASQLVLEHP